MPYFQGKTTTFSLLFRYNHALFGLTGIKPLIEDFTESRNYRPCLEFGRNHWFVALIFWRLGFSFLRQDTSYLWKSWRAYFSWRCLLYFVLWLGSCARANKWFHFSYFGCLRTSSVLVGDFAFGAAYLHLPGVASELAWCSSLWLWFCRCWHLPRHVSLRLTSRRSQTDFKLYHYPRFLWIDMD